jgi:hypothetical protein
LLLLLRKNVQKERPSFESPRFWTRHQTFWLKIQSNVSIRTFLVDYLENSFFFSGEPSAKKPRRESTAKKQKQNEESQGPIFQGKKRGLKLYIFLRIFTIEIDDDLDANLFFLIQKSQGSRSLQKSLSLLLHVQLLGSRKNRFSSKKATLSGRRPLDSPFGRVSLTTTIVSRTPS